MDLHDLISAALDQSLDGEDAVRMLAQLAELAYQKHDMSVLPDNSIDQLLPHDRPLTPSDVFMQPSPLDHEEWPLHLETDSTYSRPSPWDHNTVPLPERHVGDVIMGPMLANAGASATNFVRPKSLSGFSAVDPRGAPISSVISQAPQERMWGAPTPTPPFRSTMLRSSPSGRPRTYLGLLQNDGLCLPCPLLAHSSYEVAIEAIFASVRSRALILAPNSLLLKWPLDSQEFTELRSTDPNFRGSVTLSQKGASRASRKIAKFMLVPRGEEGPATDFRNTLKEFWGGPLHNARIEESLERALAKLAGFIPEAWPEMQLGQVKSGGSVKRNHAMGIASRTRSRTIPAQL